MGFAYGRYKEKKPKKGKGGMGGGDGVFEPTPPPIDDGMAKDCFGGICGTPTPPAPPKPYQAPRRTNKLRFVTRGVQGIRRYR